MDMRTPSPDQSAFYLARMRNGANWFYWIAALSAINAVCSFFGAEFASAIGLGVTLVIGSLAQKAGTGGMIVGFIVSLLFVGLYVLFGVKAMQRRNWAFITGLVFYALDTLLLLIFAIASAGTFIFSILIHAYAWYSILNGLLANRQLARLEEEAQYARIVHATSQASPAMLTSPVPPVSPVLPILPDSLAAPASPATLPSPDSPPE